MTTDKPKQKPRFIRNRQAILDAAREIIARHGIEELSMRTLAEVADYSPSTLYRYFENKEDILDALAQQALEQSLQDTGNQAFVEGDPVEAILQSGLNLYQFAAANPVQYMLMTSPTASAPKSLDAFLANQNFQGLLMSITTASESGDLCIPEGFTPELLALLLWFAIHGAAMLRIGMMQDYGDDADALMQNLANALKTMLSHG